MAQNCVKMRIDCLTGQCKSGVFHFEQDLRSNAIKRVRLDAPYSRHSPDSAKSDRSLCDNIFSNDR
jgi:hypothetical protein